MDQDHSWYVWRTAGMSKPRLGIFRTEEEAIAAWGRLDTWCACHPGGSASSRFDSARLYCCQTRALARSADISEIRRGECVVRHG